MSTTPEASRRLAIVSFLALLAPTYFLLAVLLKYGFGIPTLFDPIDPVVTNPVGRGRRRLWAPCSSCGQRPRRP